MAEKPDKLEFFFEYDPGFHIFPTNGVWGGLTPRGDLHLEFFVESVATPERVVNAIEGTRLGQEIERSPARRLIRRVQVGVLMSLDQAEALARFIDERLAEFKTIQAKEGAKG
jgi:hypothetical protein